MKSPSIQRRRLTALSTAAVAALIVAACGGSDGEQSSTDQEPETTEPKSADEFDLDDLIAAAQEEGELTVYDGSGRITAAAEAFEEEYGIVVNGQKVSNVEQVELVTREAESGNAQASLILNQDGPSIEQELLPAGYVQNWVPPDLVEGLEPEYTDPLQTQYSARVFGYNTEVHGDTCPVSNVWEVTEEEWTGRFQLADPLAFPETLDFFTAVVSSEADALEQAYEDHYGEPLETDEENAGWEWLKRVAQNDPVILPDDQDIIEGVGATGQAAPPFGFYHLSKLRDVEERGLESAVCRGIEPWLGYANPKYGVITTAGPSPNAAKLFVRYLLTEEGSAPWVREAVGNFSTHEDVPPNDSDPIGPIAEWRNETVFLGPDHNQQAWDLRQPMQDFWIANLG